MLLPFNKFDVILGMDWLTLHDAVVNCRRKQIVLRCQNAETISFESYRFDIAASIVSALTSRRYVYKGYEVYLTHIIDTRVLDSKLELVPTACEFLDVFPNKLPRLPPIREVEFAIEIIPWTSLIEISLYKMAPSELKEFKA